MNNNVFLILDPKEQCVLFPLRGLRPTRKLRDSTGSKSYRFLWACQRYLLFPAANPSWTNHVVRQLSQEQHRNVGAWKHTEYSECKFQLRTYCPLTSNKLRNKGTTQENALVLSREISIMRLHLFYMFRRLNQKKPETINSGYGTFLFNLFQKLESNASDEIVYFINLSFGYFIVVCSG